MISTLAMQTLADSLSVPDGGFTVDLVTSERPRTGCVVSIFPELTEALATPIMCQDLIEYVTEHHELLSEAGHLFGGWHDPNTGRVYLDVSVRVRNRSQADRLGQAYGQLAYFDLDAGASVACAPAVF